MSQLTIRPPAPVNPGHPDAPDGPSSSFDHDAHRTAVLDSPAFPEDLEPAEPGGHGDLDSAPCPRCLGDGHEPANRDQLCGYCGGLGEVPASSREEDEDWLPTEVDRLVWEEESGEVYERRQRRAAGWYKAGRDCGYAGLSLAIPMALNSDQELVDWFVRGWFRGDGDLEVDQVMRRLDREEELRDRDEAMAERYAVVGGGR